MSLSALCNVCERISFAAVRGPYPHEIRDVRENKRPGRGVTLARVEDAGDGSAAEVSKTALGSLKEIASRAESCELCSVIRDVVVEQGAVYDNGKSLWDENITFRADPDTSYYEYALDLRPGSTQNSPFITRRLCVTAHPADDIDTSLAYFNYFLQPCQLNYGQKSVREDLDQDGTKSAFVGKLFSGRLRPLVITLDLLRSWMFECDSRHGASCSSHAPSRT